MTDAFDTLVDVVTRPLEERFWEKVRRGSPEECWPWRGGSDEFGYGLFTEKSPTIRRTMKAHRWAWTFTYGLIPSGLLVLHHCDNPPCCNPAHLFVGTARDNAHDKMRKGRLRFGDARGSLNGHAKLNEPEVRVIRELVASGRKQADLARLFLVSPQTICDIVHGRRWRHV